MFVSETQAAEEVVSRLELSIGTWRFAVGRTVPKAADLAVKYDSVAWHWHPSIGILGYSRAYANLFKDLTTDRWLTGLGDGANVLDIGIGTGALSVALANNYGGAMSLHGIDISPRMLARARLNLRQLKRSGPGAQLRYADAACLPYPDGDFELVMCAHVLEHVLLPLQAMREMVRVLRASAPLLIVTTRPNGLSALHGMRWRYRSFQAGQLQDLMYQAGLNDVRTYGFGPKLSLPGQLSEAWIGRKVGDMR